MKHRLLFCSLGLLTACQLLAQTKPDGTPYSKYIEAVDEYVPAPGQFVNELPAYTEGDDAASMAAKCTERLANNEGDLVSLGGFGGYITFHFDHSVANVEGKLDFYIEGNSMKDLTNPTYTEIGGASEPGIVMVSRDDNKNGLPDDAWYELAGSADVDSVGKVDYGYEITYRLDPMKPVPWTDNRGNSGTINRVNVHKQEYFPLWLGNELKFNGTRLPNNGVDVNGDGSHWSLLFYRYGYVDNKPNTDKEACSFDIGWAVDGDRKPVSLDRIDFIRVYNAMNQQCGWIGETSTEIAGAEDLHLEESLKLTTGILNTTASEGSITEVARYKADGTRVYSPVKGINIIRMSDGTTRKVVVL